MKRDITNRDVAGNPPQSVLPAAGLLTLALVGAVLAGIALPLGRPEVTALLAAGAGVTATGASVWLFAPHRSLQASVVALFGLGMIMIAGGMIH